MILPLLLSGMLLYYHFEGLTLVYSTERLSVLGEGKEADLEGDQLAEASKSADPNAKVWVAGFKELTDAAQNADARQRWSGKMAELRGLYNPVGNRQFSLFRLRMTCCASDAVPVKVRIYAPSDLSNYGLEKGKGVVVTGQV